MAIAVQMDYDVDLCKPVQLIQMDVPFFTGDQNAHRFHVTLKRKGCSIDVSGMSARGYMVRADKQTVIWDGVVDGCDIYLTMPASCYAVAGRFRLLLRVSQGDTIETALWVEGAIRESTTDVVVDPGALLPSLNELLAQIDRLESALERAENVSNVYVGSETPPVYADVWIDVRGDVPELSNNAGKLLYIDDDGAIFPLALGAGLAIENGVIHATGGGTGGDDSGESGDDVTVAICGDAICGETICGGM